MGKKFCPKCGKETEKFFKVLCEECFSKGISFSDKLPTSIVVKTCKMCGKVFSEGESAETVGKAIDNFLSTILDMPEIESASYRIFNDVAYITVSVKVGDTTRIEKINMRIVRKSITCKYCAMKSVKYYRSKLQLRAPGNLEKIVGEIEQQAGAINKHDKLAFISSVEKVKGGYDILIGSKSAAMQIAKTLKKRYNASIKISRKLGGYISGKKVYRDTILISIK